ncbi:MAG: AsmA family protein, partial [Sphingobacteriaceae bacterium]
MPGKVKIILKIFGIVLCVLLVLWLGIAAYVTSNKKSLLADLTTQLNNNINGKLTIESMEPALIRGFPGISVSLKNVVLQDSLYQQHRHSLLDAKEVFIALNVFSFFGGKVQIEKFNINDGKIYLFTDSLGNSNSNIFKEGNDSDKKDGSKKIKRLEFRNVSFIQENQLKEKLFNFDIHRLNANIDYDDKGWEGDIQINTKVNSLAFNINKGSFIKNQVFDARLNMAYLSESGTLKIPVQAVKIGEDNFEIGGNFTSTDKSSAFQLNIIAPNIALKNVSSLLTKNISAKLSQYKLKKPFYAKALIQGALKKKGDPNIFITWKVDNSDLTVSGETLKNLSFTGYFNNERIKGRGFNDSNSILTFADVKGKYYTVPFRADTARIINLRKPIFEGRFQSSFTLEKLNSISGHKSFHFYKGAANLNLFYRAPYNKSGSTQPFIFGTLRISNATLAYHPRNLDFSNISGIFRFKGQHLFLENFRAKSGSSSFVMQASLHNFLNLYYTDPKRIKLDAHITSPQLNLGEFLSFLSKRKVSPHPNAANKSATKIFGQLDKVLDEANVHLDVKAEKLIFRRFEASNVHSSLLLSQSGIQLQHISLNHADGTLKIKGNIDQSGPVNRFKIDTRINNVNI